MSTVDSISGSSVAGAMLGQNSSGFSAMGAADFTKIIFTELSKQDPLQPNDSSQLLQQISMIRGIQADMDLTDKIGGIANQNEFAAAAGLIGKHISGITDAGQRVTDVAVSVSRTDAGPVVNLGTGDQIAMKNVDQIIDTASLPGAKP